MRSTGRAHVGRWEFLEQVVAVAGFDRVALREETAAATFDTINGPVTFARVENSLTPATFLHIQDASLELLWPQEIRTPDFCRETAW